MFLYLAMLDSDADKSKFEILYTEYKNLMYYTANRILQNRCDAEDVVHQAFLKIIEILDTISTPRCHKTKALIVTITERKAIDLYREKQRRNPLPFLDDISVLYHQLKSNILPSVIRSLQPWPHCLHVIVKYHF